MFVRKWQMILAFLALGVMAPPLTLADALQRAMKKDIPMLLDAATGTNSAYRASLIGETQDRVYIEYMTAIHAGSLFSKRQKRVVYWLPTSELSAGQLAQFKAYREREASAR